jgi:hypothetical protein
VSETEDVVTEEDVQNDGKIKAEVMGQLVSVAKRESPEIYEHFEQTCERIGVEPKILLADMLVNAINDGGYADRIEETDISLRKVKMNDIRLEDAEFIKELQERFMDKKDSDDPVDKLIERSIKGATETPFGQLNEQSGGGGREEQLEREVQRLRREVSQMKDGGTGGTATTTETEVSVSEPAGRKDPDSHEEEVDDLFGSEGGGEEEPEETMTEEEPEPDTGDAGDMTEEEFDEAVESMEEEREMAEEWRAESEPPDEDENVEEADVDWEDTGGEDE